MGSDMKKKTEADRGTNQYTAAFVGAETAGRFTQEGHASLRGCFCDSDIGIILFQERGIRPVA